MNDLDLCLEVVQCHVDHCGVNSSKTTLQHHRFAMSYHCYLTVGFCILDSLLSGSTVGYPSDILASRINGG